MLYTLRSMLRLIWRPTNVPAALALFVIVVAGLFAEYQNRRINEERLRADVLAQVSLIRAKLEGNINSNIQLVRGLVATLSTEPSMSQRRFSHLASNLFTGRSQLRIVAGAPNLVVTMIHPLEGNEQAMGLNYNENQAQREAALRARDAGELVLAGPVDLVQGGRGFVGRFPVFVNDLGGEKRFWGIVSAVVDLERLYRDSGLLDADLPIDIAISGRDGMGAGRALFRRRRRYVEGTRLRRRGLAVGLLAHCRSAERGLGPDTVQRLDAQAGDLGRRRADPDPDSPDRAPDRREAKECRRAAAAARWSWNGCRGA